MLSNGALTAYNKVLKQYYSQDQVSDDDSAAAARQEKERDDEQLVADADLLRRYVCSKLEWLRENPEQGNFKTLADDLRKALSYVRSIFDLQETHVFHAYQIVNILFRIMHVFAISDPHSSFLGGGKAMCGEIQRAIEFLVGKFGVTRLGELDFSVNGVNIKDVRKQLHEAACLRGLNNRVCFSMQRDDSWDNFLLNSFREDLFLDLEDAMVAQQEAERAERATRKRKPGESPAPAPRGRAKKRRRVASPPAQPAGISADAAAAVNQAQLQNLRDWAAEQRARGGQGLLPVLPSPVPLSMLQAQAQAQAQAHLAWVAQQALLVQQGLAAPPPAALFDGMQPPSVPYPGLFGMGGRPPGGVYYLVPSSMPQTQQPASSQPPFFPPHP